MRQIVKAILNYLWLLRSYTEKSLSVLRGTLWRLYPGVKMLGTSLLVGPHCRLCVEPGGKLYFGRNCNFDRDVEIVVYPGGILEFGDQVYVGHGTTIACAQSITISTDTLIGDLITIRDMNHRRQLDIPLRHSGIETYPVRIGRNCWLGSKVTMTAGAEIGDEVTVAANAVVTGQFGDRLLLGGIPAKVLRILE